jgi:hypothetical protein
MFSITPCPPIRMSTALTHPAAGLQSTHRCHMQDMGRNQGSEWPGCIGSHKMAGVCALRRQGLLLHMALQILQQMLQGGRQTQLVVLGMPSMPCAWRKQPSMRSRTTCDCLTWRRRHCSGNHMQRHKHSATGQRGQEISPSAMVPWVSTCESHQRATAAQHAVRLHAATAKHHRVCSAAGLGSQRC